MTNLETATKYFEDFHKGKIERVLSYFRSDGVVKYGTEGPKPATEFFPETRDFIAQIEFETHGVYSSTTTDNILIHFSFSVPREDGSMETTEAVDIIEFDEAGKIKRVTVIPNA